MIIDGRNVERSTWPNIPSERLVELARAWAKDEGVTALLVFDGTAPVESEDVVGTGNETADDWIAREAERHAPYWLDTSDRELRRRAGRRAERVIGGGSFAKTLTR